MVWKCRKCGETSTGDGMGFAIMHETLSGPEHVVEPDPRTAARWAAVLGELNVDEDVP